MKRLLLCAIVIALSQGIVSCGQSGGLYLPQPAAKTKG